MPRMFTDDNGVDWVHARDAKELSKDKYEDKIYKIIRVPFDAPNMFDSDYEGDVALQRLEDEVNDFMDNADDDYSPVGVPTVMGNTIFQVLVDEDYS